MAAPGLVRCGSAVPVSVASVAAFVPVAVILASPKSRQDVSFIFEVVKHKLAAFFLKEKAKGKLAKQANEECLADFCIATIPGAMLMGKITRSSQTAETTVLEALAHLKGYTVTSSAESAAQGGAFFARVGSLQRQLLDWNPAYCRKSVQRASDRVLAI
jgi:hypothetical protein